MNAGQRLKAISKAMSWALRHEAERLKLTVDPEGYVPLAELIDAVNAHARLGVVEADIQKIVEDGDSGKQRFSIIGEWIRANYGHTLSAEVSHPTVSPPEFLYHGTSVDKVAAILGDGLKPMLRQFVHLTTEPALAKSVGGRHGKPIVLVVSAAKAHASGIGFFKANERFWLSKMVPTAFIEVPTD